ncbi:uncharacterized protein SPSK_08069 [Sporothrix schenckii 1099-18]|uniref:Uncharacterized protein n=1 Tax=Sporothrix schenckii 1099-18 TaxID=1397361 RepID=A0A0F2MGY9_SPOSC|nr:uncharacterized protein SPSK_08069 [Sporothrix schenckii 1099-18]KJR88339.1 hypothetical protein SPSK_08069 [Sporothrix schenckii 1099-18]
MAQTVARLKQVIDAASASAGIFSALLQGDAMSRRCWIVMYVPNPTNMFPKAQWLAFLLEDSNPMWHASLSSISSHRDKGTASAAKHDKMADDTAKEFHAELEPLHDLAQARTPSDHNQNDGGSICRGLHDGYDGTSLLLTLSLFSGVQQRRALLSGLRW